MCIVYISVVLFLLSILVCMESAAGASGVRAPAWDPNGHVPFRLWVQELQAWLTVTSGRLTPPQQAAAIQLGLRGSAREYALQIPAAAISFGAPVAGVPADPVTFILYQLASRFAPLEDETALEAGTALLDFTSRQGERIDQLLTRWDMVRHEAQAVGAGIGNFTTLSTILLRAVGISTSQMMTLLQPFGGRMPANQQQYD